jgi:hypothetical protein
MNELLVRLKVANDWSEYYQAYKAVYKEVLERRWALGKPTFANQLHHTAVPDASGAALGSIGWAAYSQPSDASLSAFLGVFAALAINEPHRLRSNRYLFLVPNDPPLSRNTAATALSSIANKLDYWCGSLEEALAWPESSTSLQSINAMFQAEVPIVTQSDAEALVSSANTKVDISALRSRIIDTSLTGSTVPPATRRAYLESGVVLAAIQLGLSAVEIVDVCGSGVGIAAFIACDRATASEWQHNRLATCKAILALAPPATKLYKVAPGDILTRLVRTFYEQPFESLWPLISVLNPEVTDPNFIRIGQELRLPVLGDAPHR